MPAGTFGIRAGGIMAASDEFTIVIEGQGGHAAMPHNTIDPVVIAAQLVVALQTLVSRNVDPMRSAVLSVTMIQAGEAFNIIPRTVKMTGTVRTLDPEVRDLMEEQAQVGDARVSARPSAPRPTVTYRRGYPVTVNAARPDRARRRTPPATSPAMPASMPTPMRVMGGEDFSFMLQARPGAYIFLGNGDSSELHTDTYDFNDDIIPVGVSYWVRLAETALPAT